MTTKKTLGLKGKLKTTITLFVVLGVILLLLNIGLFFIDVQAGLLVLCFTILYCIFFVIVIINDKNIIMNELISFATQYGQVQRRLIRDLELPYALLDDNNRIIWTNTAFNTAFHIEKDYRKSITSIFPSLNKDSIPNASTEEEMRISLGYEECNYTVNMRRIFMRDMAADNDIIEMEDYNGYLVACFFYDETALKIALREIDDQSVAVGLIYIDNYDEALESVEEVRRSLLIALIDRKVNRYISGIDGICKKIEKDKFLVILRKKALATLEESRFDLLQDVKTVNIGNEMAVTLSMGIGLDGLSYAQNYEFARNAIDMALGRGGDQAVVKTPSNLSYYGGKTQQIEKSTRVKARVKAQALQEIISGKDEVYIMGHRNGDVDCFGAAIGMYRAAKTMDKPIHIVLNDISLSLQPIVDMFRNNPDYEPDLIVSGSTALERVGNNAALIIVDVNKPSITECPDLIKHCKAIVVLDHHRQGQETVENATLSYVEPYASSACELASEILQYIGNGNGTKLKPEEADAMYAGIVLDTSNFMSKTGVRTFEAAAYLRRNGADVVRVRKMFRDNALDYKARADVVSQAEIFHDAYAISTNLNEDNLDNPTIIGAQAANELLNIRGIKASFVLTNYNNMINVSARSIDEVNVQIIMEKMGGGGHMNMAACQLSMTIEEAIGLLKTTIDEMIANKELE